MHDSQNQNKSIHSSRQTCFPKVDLTLLSTPPPTDGWKASRRTSRTQTCTTTPWLVRATSTGALSSLLITSWLRRRLSSQRRSPCSPGMRLNIRSPLASRCRSGTLTTSLLMTSWVRPNGNWWFLTMIFDFFFVACFPKFHHPHCMTTLTVTTLRCNWVGPKSVPSWRQDSQAVLPWHDQKWAGPAHHFHLQTKEGQGLVAVCSPRWERWDGAHGTSDVKYWALILRFIDPVVPQPAGAEQKVQKALMLLKVLLVMSD